MKCYINGNELTKAIHFYTKYIGLIDDISHILIIQTCLICSDFDFYGINNISLITG